MQSRTSTLLATIYTLLTAALCSATGILSHSQDVIVTAMEGHGPVPGSLP